MLSAVVHAREAKMVNRFKWKLISFIEENGIIKYTIANGSTKVDCTSQKPKSEVKADIQKSLDRLNKKPKTKGL